MFGCIISKPVDFLDWRICFFVSCLEFHTARNKTQEMVKYIICYEYTQSDAYMLVITYKLIYSFEKAMYNFAPYVLFLIDKQVFFLSVILVEILKNFVNNHTREKHFVPVYSMTVCWGSRCIPAFIRNLRTTWK